MLSLPQIQHNIETLNGISVMYITEESRKYYINRAKAGVEVYAYWQRNEWHVVDGNVDTVLPLLSKFVWYMTSAVSAGGDKWSVTAHHTPSNRDITVMITIPYICDVEMNRHEYVNYAVPSISAIICRATEEGRDFTEFDGYVYIDESMGR
jgi:hypothetical protein